MAGRSEIPLSSQLKSTCDACNSAKVKCSQARPQCGRCESRGLYCHYSASLRSAKRRYQPSFNDIASSGKSHSPESYENMTTPAPAVSSDASVLSSYDISSFQDADFAPPLLDGWNNKSNGSSGQTPYSDNGDESMMILSQLKYPDNLSSWQSPVSRGSRPRHTAQFSTNGDDAGSMTSAVSLSSACSCQQNALDKLSELSVSRREGSSVPFDRSLSENKHIITLCTSLISCPNKQHDRDITLMLTNVALITHLISVYDHPLPTPSKDSSGDFGAIDPAIGEESNSRLSHSGSITSGRELGQHQHSQLLSRVRLSLGSYQLDQKDEQILQKNLLKIELSKIGGLIDSFEKRFCVPDYGWVTGDRNQPLPLGEIITYLKKRLRAVFESLASLAGHDL